MEVKFLDPGSIFQLVKSQVKQSLGGTKTTHGQHTYREDKTTQTTTISLNNHQNHSSGETKRSHNTTDTSLWSVANIQTTIQNKQTQTAYV
jgi:DNA mismatch repair ATPase MutL